MLNRKVLHFTWYELWMWPNHEQISRHTQRPCPETSQFTITLAFQWNRLTNFQLANLSTDDFLHLPSQRASLFLRQCAINWIISNCQPLTLKFPRLKKSWLNVQFLTLFGESISTEGLQMFSANPTSHRTAFECFVKFSIVEKYMSLLFPQENPHTHFILASGTAICKPTCSHFITN